MQQQIPMILFLLLPINTNNVCNMEVKMKKMRKRISLSWVGVDLLEQKKAKVKFLTYDEMINARNLMLGSSHHALVW